MNKLKKGDIVSGFEVVSVTDLNEYKGSGILIKHIKTGCQIYHIICDDDENFFSFNFRTPSKDNTGVAHIIEHAVLSGSRKFPVKDPFQTLMKGSVNTFMNAMTYPDKTIYPAGTTIRKDYFNIMEVYGDAVFFPLLRKETFLQEGHRFELDETGELKIGGVVFNEMTGAYASSESIVNEWSYRSLFTNSPYKFDSGGTPEDITKLTYNMFLDYHKTYYHPSNCSIFLYGNIPTVTQLEFIENNFLSGFEKKVINSGIDYQERWSNSRYLEKYCQSSDVESPAGKTVISINWLLGDICDPVNVLSMEMLSEILLGNAGSPLQIAVLESGLGEDLSPVSGLEVDLLEMVFSIGVRGSSPDKTAEFEKLVLDKFRQLIADRIPLDVITGAMKRVEFRNREIKGGIPFGLRLLGKTLRGWLHDCPPETTLGFSEPLNILKERLNDNPCYFEELIDSRFISNPHRTTVVVKPDSKFEKNADKSAERLKELKRSMSLSDLTDLKKEIESLESFQDTPDSEKSVNSIPSISIKDLPTDIKYISTETEKIVDVPLYVHDLFTNGIAYIDIAFDISTIEKSLSMYLPLFCRVICSSGFSDVPYDEVARQLSIKTGGIFTFLESNEQIGKPGDEQDYLFIRLKSLEETLPEAITLLRKILFDSDLTDKKRIKDLLFEQRNDYRSSVLSMGSSLAALRAAGKLSPVLAKEESWRGVEQYLFLNKSAEYIDETLDLIISSLQEIRDYILIRSRLILNITAAKQVFPKLKELLSEFLNMIPEKEKNSINKKEIFVRKSGTETLEAVTSIGFNAMAFPAARLESKAHAYEQILAHLLKTEYLWEKIRMKGGAYGVSASADGLDGIFTFTSYRDPEIIETLKGFIEGLEYYADKFSDIKAVEKAIISIVGKTVRPMSPGEKSLIGFRRKLYGITDEIRKNTRFNILNADYIKVSTAAASLLTKSSDAVRVIMAGAESIAEASLIDNSINENSVKIPL